MRTLLVTAATAALLATSAMSFAATQQASGTVKVFDSKAMTLTLADGDIYNLPKNFKDPGLKVGEKVSVLWDKNGNAGNSNQQRDAVSVTVVK